VMDRKAGATVFSQQWVAGVTEEGGNLPLIVQIGDEI